MKQIYDFSLEWVLILSDRDTVGEPEENKTIKVTDELPAHDKISGRAQNQLQIQRKEINENKCIKTNFKKVWPT